MDNIDRITELTIGAAYKVANFFGPGFLESVYEKSMLIELRKLNLKVERRKSIQVFYDNECVGDFIADLFVEGCLIVELKSAIALVPAHEVQLVNYLKATGINHGLLINFGEAKVDVRRKYRLLSKPPNVQLPPVPSSP